MKHKFATAMMLLGVIAFAQSSEELQGRIGININKPRATMDIVGKPITDADKTIPRGIIFPHITTAQRDTFDTSKLIKGTMIYNTTSNYIDVWTGSKWQSLDFVPPPTITYYSTKSYTGSAEFSTTTCSNGQIIGKITHTGTTSASASSTISQTDADNKALASAQDIFNQEGQEKADREAPCDNVKTYCVISQVFTAYGTLIINGQTIRRGFWTKRSLFDELKQHSQGGTFSVIYSEPRDQNRNIEDCRFEVLP